MGERTQKDAGLWERSGEDWYVEEERASRALFRAESFNGIIWDPSCGGGNIVKSALAAGYAAIGSDIVRRVDAPWFVERGDFLSYEGAAHNVVCNPPFFRGKGTEAFIRKAIAVASGKVCIFSDIKFLASDGRAKGLWSQFPPTRIYSISPRVSCPPGSWLEQGNKAGGGTADWIWSVWDLNDTSRRTEFLWLRAVE